MMKSAYTAWQSLLEKLGLTGKHVFHNTKATFVTAVAQEMPDFVVKDLSRHRDIKTTMRYVKVADKTRRQGVESVTEQLFSRSENMPQNPENFDESKKVTNKSHKQSLLEYRGPKLSI